MNPDLIQAFKENVKRFDKVKTYYGVFTCMNKQYNYKYIGELDSFFLTLESTITLLDISKPNKFVYEFYTEKNMNAILFELEEYQKQLVKDEEYKKSKKDNLK